MVTVKRILLIAVALVVVLATASVAAADTACFDWVSCPVNEVQFDASCSSGSPYIWKYRFYYGDGTSTFNTGNAIQTHVYPGDGIQAWNVTVEIVTFYQTTQVTCQIWSMDAFYYGPPQCQVGRCSSN